MYDSAMMEAALEKKTKAQGILVGGKPIRLDATQSRKVYATFDRIQRDTILVIQCLSRHVGKLISDYTVVEKVECIEWLRSEEGTKDLGTSQ